MLFAGFLGPGPGPRNPVDVEAERLQKEGQTALEKYLGGHSRPCGGDICLDVAVQFAPNDDGISGAYRERLAQACKGLLGAVQNHPKELEISIEGHTDSTQPQNVATDRDYFLYNWHLSAKRASSVLYEFKSCGVAPPEYKIVALG
jgi:flagellar motor protein MotB